jgi:hypothetical protein
MILLKAVRNARRKQNPVLMLEPADIFKEHFRQNKLT